MAYTNNKHVAVDLRTHVDKERKYSHLITWTKCLTTLFVQYNVL